MTPEKRTELRRQLALGAFPQSEQIMHCLLDALDDADYELGKARAKAAADWDRAVRHGREQLLEEQRRQEKLHQEYCAARGG